MAFHQLLCGATLVILLTSRGCHSYEPACGQLMKGHEPGDSLPWQAFITLNGSHRCLGTVVSKWWVLTNGGCGAGPDLNAEVLLGGEDYKKPYPVKGYKCSYNMNGSRGENEDLCLLELTEALTFNGSISPVCLAAKGSRFHSGENRYVSTGSRKEPTVKVPLVGYNECKCRHPSVRMNKVCAGKGEESAMAEECQMSMGGALMDHFAMTWTLIGVAGFDERCLTPSSSKSYTRVSYFQDWIKAVTASSPPDFVLSQPKGIDPDEKFVCPTGCKNPPEPPKCDNPHGCDDLSIFDSGVSLTPSFPFILLSVLALSLYSTRW